MFLGSVLQLLPAWGQALFVIALVSALFPSAIGAVTARTSCSRIDLLGLRERGDLDAAARTRIRRRVHAGCAGLFMALMLGFKALDDPTMIGLILKIAAYT